MSKVEQRDCICIMEMMAREILYVIMMISARWRGRCHICIMTKYLSGAIMNTDILCV